MYEWPEWVKPGTYMAMDEGGGWSLFSSNSPPRPVKGSHKNGYWVPGDYSTEYSSGDLSWVIDFPWPEPVEDWTKSLMQKPYSGRSILESDRSMKLFLERYASGDPLVDWYDEGQIVEALALAVKMLLKSEGE